MDTMPNSIIENCQEDGKIIFLGNRNNQNITKDGLEHLNQSSSPNQNTMNQANPSSSVKRPGIQKPVVERAPRSLFLFTSNNKFRKL